MRRTLQAALGVLSFVCAAPALAQSGASAAEQEFNAGRAAEQSGDLARACTHYRAAMALDRKAGALRQSARCDAREGHVLDAIAKMDEAIAQIPTDNPNHAEYASERGALKSSLAKLTLTLRPDTASPVVTLDGLPAPPWGEAREIDPGEHVVVVRGATVAEQKFTMEKGEERTLMLPFEVSAPEVPAPTSSSDDGPWLVLAAVSFGVSGAAAIATIATGVLVLDADAEAEAACSAPQRLGCGDAVDDANALLGPNLAMWIVMGVSAGAGLAFTIVHATSSDANASGAQPATSIHLGPGGVGLSRTF